VDSHSVNIHPEWATGIVGGEVQINCEVEFGPNYEMTWDFNTVFVYIIANDVEQYPQGTSKYSLQRTGMNFTLIVKDLKLDDQGEYMCTSYKSEATAFLMVLDTPSITFNPPVPVEGDAVVVTCEAKFGGPRKDLILPHHFPNLKMISLIKMATFKETTEFKESYSISLIKFFTGSSSMNKINISCELETAAELSMKTSIVAVFNVLYSVRAIDITPIQEKYKVGDNISCVANSNPAAVYEWKNAHGATTITGKLLKISESMIGENNWECVARNEINGELFEERKQTRFVAAEIPSEPRHDGLLTVVAVESVIVPLFIIAVALCFWKKIREIRERKKNVSLCFILVSYVLSPLSDDQSYIS